MKKLDLTLLRSLTRFQYWLLTLFVGLNGLYLCLLWQADDSAQIGMSILFWLAAGALFWEKREQFTVQRDRITTILGYGLVGGLLALGFHLWGDQGLNNWPNLGLRSMPLLSSVAVGLIGFGLPGLRQLWRELTILFFLGIPSAIATTIIDPSPITAKYAALMLHYVGFDVMVQGVYVMMSTGSVRVFEECSGTEAMTYLLGVSVICLLMFPVSGAKRFWVPFLAMAIGFTINALRVAIMAAFVSMQQMELFKYWHEGDGSIIFGAIGVVIFWCCYQILLRSNPA